MGTIVFRSAEIRDIKKIVGLEIECMGELKAEIGGEFPAFDETRNNESNLLSVVEGGWGFAMVAEDDDFGTKSLVGAVIAVDRDFDADSGDRNILTLTNLFVAEGHRRQGIARRLLEEVEVWAKDQGYIELQALMYTPNPAMSHILDTTGMTVIFEGKKKILDPEKYKAMKAREDIEYYSNRRAYLSSKSNNSLVDL